MVGGELRLSEQVALQCTASARAPADGSQAIIAHALSCDRATTSATSVRRPTQGRLVSPFSNRRISDQARVSIPYNVTTGMDHVIDGYLVLLHVIGVAYETGETHAHIQMN